MRKRGEFTDIKRAYTRHQIVSILGCIQSLFRCDLDSICLLMTYIYRQCTLNLVLETVQPDLDIAPSRLHDLYYRFLKNVHEKSVDFFNTIPQFSSRFLTRFFIPTSQHYVHGQSCGVARRSGRRSSQSTEPCGCCTRC